jgi:hypothetical protein
LAAAGFCNVLEEGKGVGNDDKSITPAQYGARKREGLI